MIRIGKKQLIIALVACVSVGPLQATASVSKTLTISSDASDISTLDPHRATSTGDKSAVSWMFNGLVRFKPGSADPRSIEPDLAHAWETSSDGLEWTFRLRNGVLFHGNWGELTADDVVYSLKRAADPKRSSYASNYKAIDEVHALDSSTVKIRLKHSVPSLLGLVANYHGGMIVSRKADEAPPKGSAAKPVGTGPFAYAEHVTQQYMKLVAHDRYFRGPPKIDEIMVRFIPSDASRDLAFTTGEIDLYYGRREQRWVNTTRTSGAAKIDIFQPGEYRTLHINRTIKPLNDIRVRKAIAMAINVDEIVSFVGGDVGPRGCSVVPPGYLGEDCSAGVHPYDREEAKRLLAEAGHPNGFSIPVTVSNISGQLPIMEIIQSQLAKVGIRLEMNVVDHPTYHDLIRKNVSALVFYGAARFPVADSYLSEFYHSAATVGTSTAITNFSHCDVADSEITSARSESNAERQLALWKAAQQKIHGDVCAVPLFNLLQVWARSPRVDYGYSLEGALNLAPMITETTSIHPR